MHLLGRIYAVTLGNIPMVVGFVIITACQLGLGICVTTLVAKQGAQPFPTIPLDAYHLCIPLEYRHIEIAYTSISLFFDFLAFSLIIFMATKSEAWRNGFSTILRTIAKDATWYFLVIFTSHLVFVFTLNLGPEAIQLLPATGIVVYLPLMISRIMLSLKKASHLPQNCWSLVGPTTNGAGLRSMEFRRPRRGIDARADGIQLGAYRESQTA